MAKKIKEKLVVRPVVRRQLAEEFGCCERTVYYALSNVSDGEQPDAIRARALELGARVQKTYALD